MKVTIKKDPAKVAAAIARKKALSPEERSTIAKNAAVARWGERPLKATHRGSFKEEFGIDVECYVLDDDQKTAVLSQRGMGAALGLGQSTGARLPRFLRGEKIAPYVGAGLSEKLAKPLVFQWSPVVLAAKAPGPAPIHGYDVTILIDICKAVLAAEADGKLLKSQANIARQAHVIVNASAKAGIKNLVYALAGYDATRAEVIAAFKLYVQTEARDYEREFPEQLYAEWYRLYGLPKPRRNKPWKFRHLTVDQVYKPLARSNGKILALTREQKAASDDRYAKLHQFLSEIGVKALRTHLGQLLGIAQISDDKATYERHVEKLFGKQQSLDFRPRG